MFLHLTLCSRVTDRSERETGYLVGLLSNLIFPGSDRLADPREVIDGIYLELHEAVARPCVTFFLPWISGSELGGPGPPSASHGQRAPGDVPGPRPAEGVTTPGTKDGILSGFAENCHVGGVT